MNLNEKKILEVGLTQGLAAWYPLLNDTNDYAGGNHGVNSGAFGELRGFSFDGVDDIIISKDNTFSIWNNISVFAWVKPSAEIGSMNIVGKRMPDNTGWIIHNGTPNILRTYVHTNGAWSQVDTVDVYVIGQWVHVGFIYNGSTLQNWVNGVASDSIAVSGSITQTESPIAIGGWSSDPPTQYWPGVIDDVRVYNRALSTAEVGHLYDQKATSINRVMRHSKSDILLTGQFREI